MEGNQEGQGRPVAQAAEPRAPGAPNVHNGTYTVEHPQHGHFTVRLWTVLKSDDPHWLGKRFLGLLVGPDNTRDFRAVGTWDDEAKCASVWKKHRGPDSHFRVDGYHWQDRGWSVTEQKLAIWCDLAIRGGLTEGRYGTNGERRSHWYGQGYRLLLEGQCVACNRKLTHPESIKTGIGPECAKRNRP